MSIEDDVRTGLRTSAGDLPVHATPHRMHSAGLRERIRVQRRRRTGLAGAGLAVALVVAGVPIGVAALRPDPSSTAVPASDAVDILGLPTRGSLAGDQAFLDAVVQLDWSTPDTRSDPTALVVPVDSRRVVFAGDVPGGRWAFVVGENPEPSTLDPELQTDLGAMSEVAGLWFVGPEGAAADQLTAVTVPRGLTPDRVQSLSDPSTGTVVVLAAPGDEIALSDRPVVAADATVTREWAAAGPDGLAVARLPVSATYSGTAGRFRVIRDDVEIDRRSPDQFGRPEGFEVPVVPIEYLGERVPAAEVWDQQEAARVLGDLGLGVDDVRFQVLWAGAIPGPGDDPTYTTVMTATLPSGAVAVLGWDLQVIDAGGGAVYYGGGSGLRELRPAGVPAIDVVVAMRSEVYGAGGRSVERSLVVVVPEGATQVRALDDDGSELAIQSVAGGAAVGPFPDGTVAVEVQFVDGRPAVTSPLGTFTGDF